MKSSYAYRRDRVQMILLFLFFSILFVVINIGLEYLKEFRILVLFMKFFIIMAPVGMILSLLGIIATSLLIKEMEMEKE
ncbi:hypothetical protein COI86_27950 [Bacillus thuringiensis]|uniref:hypothetical protein n=1 Tax=Bacillus thuringiensis TaxID=1428 RepID=UPI000BF3907B|nr:hypothetical protein [Bacillus thuringiensis]PFI83496.1 hypothetical protein COI86_27950 [Bacillus thuringiensis]